MLCFQKRFIFIILKCMCIRSGQKYWLSLGAGVRSSVEPSPVSSHSLKTYSCSLRDGRSPSRNLTSFSHRLSINASCLSGSRIKRRDTTLFITLSTSAQATRTQSAEIQHSACLVQYVIPSVLVHSH